MGKIITVFANKGGVGKTTTALSLSHALARKGVKTLVMDIDSQCNTTDPLLGEDPQHNLVDVLEGKVTIEDSIRFVRGQRNYFCLPNSSELVRLEPTLIRQGVGGFDMLKNAIQDYCRENFDITIIDCPPNHGVMTINALVASDLALVPTEAGSRNSIKGLKSALRFIDEIRSEANPELQFLRILVTKHDGRTKIARDYVGQLQDVFGERVFKTIIPVNVDFKYAEDAGKTIFQYSAKAPGTTAYRRVADEVINVLGLK